MEREKEGEKHQWVAFSHVYQLRTEPATQVCALTGNQTDKLLLFSMMLNQLSNTDQGWTILSLFSQNLEIVGWRGVDTKVWEHNAERALLSFLLSVCSRKVAVCYMGHIRIWWD